MKISFSWLDRNGKTKWPIKLRFGKYWNGQIWIAGFWKWSITIDFRNEGFLGYIKKIIWENRLKNRQN